ncbi:MAG: flagellar motor protein MotB [Candidatus Latescibacterota bacterium]|jgi:chemotaxis protein MotB
MAEEEDDSPREAEKDRSERWLLTYADLITLLLIFFIIMYVFSKQDVTKFKAMATSLRSAFQGTSYVVGKAPGPGLRGGGRPGQGTGAAQAEDQALQRVQQEVQELAKQQGLQQEMSVSVEEKGAVVRLSDQVLFASGQAELSGPARQILQGVGEILRKEGGFYLRVEGHTDDVPIGSRYPSNWELSAARAASVVRLFVSDVGIDPGRLWVTGYGEYRPVADNRTEAGRAANRRIEIVMLKSKYNATEDRRQR